MSQVAPNVMEPEKSASGPFTADKRGILQMADNFTFSSSVVMLSEAAHPQAEAVRTLRTHIVAQHVELGRRGIAICAPTADVGCTFVAVNLAVALAQIGVKTLLVDGDLRQPSLDSFIRPPEPVAGLKQAIVDGVDLAGGGIQSDVLPNLSLLYAGGRGSDAQELLASDAYRDLVEKCLRDYDLTIFDTPPANICADGRRISTLVGYSLIVARRNQTFVGDIAALAEQLRQDRAHVIGTVMSED